MKVSVVPIAAEHSIVPTDTNTNMRKIYFFVSKI